MDVLCLDAGSSSLKAALYRAARGVEPTRIGVANLPACANTDTWLELVLDHVAVGTRGIVDAIGHRIVFGGPRYTSPTIADDVVLTTLEESVAIEPLHLRAELDLVYAARRKFPAALQVLCFDTAFHRSAPDIARALPLPPDLDPLIQRYGFHGLSYEYIVSQLPSSAGRTIVAHLGSGASLCALKDGKPVDTTMGFSALGGLMMGTRPGDLDPGIVLRLLATGEDTGSLTDLLYHRSGLLGVSGTTADMQRLIETMESDERARQAVDLFVYQLLKHIGAMIAVLGGLDTLVFTGGIGEHSPFVRAAVSRAITYVGTFDVLVIPTDENLMIARHTLAALFEKFPADA